MEANERNEPTNKGEHARAACVVVWCLSHTIFGCRVLPDKKSDLEYSGYKQEITALRLRLKDLEAAEETTPPDMSPSDNEMYGSGEQP